MPSTAKQVARFSDKGATHALRKPWNYAQHWKNVTLCGRDKPRAVEYTQSGAELPVTCGSCRRNLLIGE